MNTITGRNLIFIIAAVVSLAWLTACEESMPTQPENDLIDGQYIVAFNNIWDDKRDPDTINEIREFTDQFFIEYAIDPDSVVARFEFALRGFTARMDESKAEQIREDSRVDGVYQDRVTSVL